MTLERLNKYKWWIGGAVLVPVAIALLIYRPGWTGFGPDTTKSTERNAADQVTKTVEAEQSGKTLWDWMSVLGVPLSLALLGVWFQRREQERVNEQVQLERERAEQQATLEREIATANQREEALQAYFDRLSTLLIDQNLIAVAARVKKAKETAEAQQDTAIDEQKELLSAAVDVIRARTLSILRQFRADGERKSSVIRFLIEAEAIDKLNLNLSCADLSHADVCHASLGHANLSSAHLNNANLSGANLGGANLGGADFSGADLSSAHLGGANLSFAMFSGANLSGANLNGAKNCTEEQLSSARLCRTKLPEGCNLDPDRDC